MPSSLNEQEYAQLSTEEQVTYIEATLKARREECLRRRQSLYVRCELGGFHEETGEWCSAEEWRDSVLKRCKEDFFFFMYYYAWTVDPRLEDQELVFLLYDFQKEGAKWVLDNVEQTRTRGKFCKRNLLVEKSRDMGWSWLIYYIAVWLWLFKEGHILIGSNTAGDVDKIGDLNTPIEKCRYIIRHLPGWMLPAGFNINEDMPEKLIRASRKGGAQIRGKASTGSFGRGPRCLLIILDEFQSWQNAKAAWKSCSQTANCRAVIGTPDGPHNHYAHLARGKTKDKVIKIRTHWSQHPVKRAGLRVLPNGDLTSPWYEAQKEGMSPEDVASELDIKYDTSTGGLIFTEFSAWHKFPGLMPEDDCPIVVVWDPGLTFFVLFMQVDKWGRVLILREFLIDKNARIDDVANGVVQILQKYYSDFEHEHYGDPAGSGRSNSGQVDPEYVTLADDYDIYVEYLQIQEIPTRTRTKVKHQAIKNVLTKLCPATGTPLFLVDPENAPSVVEALEEGYRWKVDRRTQEVLPIVDEQHPYEDAVDTVAYGIISKLGAPNETSTTKGSKVKIAKGTVKWRGRNSSGGRKRYA